MLSEQVTREHNQIARLLTSIAADETTHMSARSQGDAIEGIGRNSLSV
jgi:hypothetical protein